MSTVEYFLLANLTLWVRGCPSLSQANFTTLQSTRRVALYKIFRVQDVHNLWYIQSRMSILPIIFAVGLRKLLFLHKLSVHAMSTVHVVFYCCF